MRRTALLLACALLVVTALPAPAGPVRDDYWAISYFQIGPDGGRFDLYLVGVLAGGDIGEQAHIHGGLLKATDCRTHRKSDGSETLRCRSIEAESLRDSDRFEIEIDASQASLLVRRRDHVHRMTWAATDQLPGLAGWAEACNSGQGEGTGIARDARAEGRLFGRKLEGEGASRSGIHLLVHGATVTQCLPWLSNAEFDDLFDGGVFSLTY